MAKRKLKTKKTLAKRIKITKSGKILRKQIRTGHLFRKMDASRRMRKRRIQVQGSKRIVKKLKQMVGMA